MKELSPETLAFIDSHRGDDVRTLALQAKKYPAVDMDHSWLFARLPDGTAVRP